MILDDLTIWWDGRPRTEFVQRGSVFVTATPGDRTCYRLVLTNVSHAHWPGRPLVTISFFEGVRCSAEFGDTALAPNRRPFAHTMAYVGSKLGLRDQYGAAEALAAQLVGLACHEVLR